MGDIVMGDIVRVIVMDDGEKFEGISMVVIDPCHDLDVVTLASRHGMLTFNKNRIFPGKIMYGCEEAERAGTGR